jgi:C4-dicarboxylate-specific signal transduction histidine kinase
MVTDPDAEIRRLRIGLRDLVALSTIPAAWVGREPPAIAAGLADVLVGSLHLDGAFVRLCDPRGGDPVEVTRGNASNGFRESLQRHLAAVGQLSRRDVIRDLDGAGRCRAVVIPIGIDAEGGLVAATSERTDFPTEVDQLLLSVAANHAATAFQSARVQQELRQARTGLEREVAERTAELRQDIEDRRRAEEALRQAQAELVHVSRVTTLGEMAASIAHEVDQPLSGVVINAQACLRFLGGACPNLDEVRDGLQAIARDGRRAADVIGRIRTLARRTATEKEPLDVNEVIGEVLVLAEGEARRTRASVRTELAGNLPRVIGDRVQLQQVVLNLLLNGLEAMHAVVRRPRELVIRTQREAIDRVRVGVQDSGSGIDPQLANRIFDAFYTTKPGGMGMGLSISRSIVEQHGGRLWAAPNDGPGTTFHFIV